MDSDYTIHAVPVIPYDELLKLNAVLEVGHRVIITAYDRSLPLGNGGAPGAFVFRGPAKWTGRVMQVRDPNALPKKAQKSAKGRKKPSSCDQNPDHQNPDTSAGNDGSANAEDATASPPPAPREVKVLWNGTDDLMPFPPKERECAVRTVELRSSTNAKIVLSHLNMTADVAFVPNRQFQTRSKIEPISAFPRFHALISSVSKTGTVTEVECLWPVREKDVTVNRTSPLFLATSCLYSSLPSSASSAPSSPSSPSSSKKGTAAQRNQTSSRQAKEVKEVLDLGSAMRFMAGCRLECNDPTTDAKETGWYIIVDIDPEERKLRVVPQQEITAVLHRAQQRLMLYQPPIAKANQQQNPKVSGAGAGGGQVSKPFKGTTLLNGATAAAHSSLQDVACAAFAATHTMAFSGVCISSVGPSALIRCHDRAIGPAVAVATFAGRATEFVGPNPPMLTPVTAKQKQAKTRHNQNNESEEKVEEVIDYRAAGDFEGLAAALVGHRVNFNCEPGSDFVSVVEVAAALDDIPSTAAILAANLNQEHDDTHTDVSKPTDCASAEGGETSAADERQHAPDSRDGHDVSDAQQPQQAPLVQQPQLVARTAAKKIQSEDVALGDTTGFFERVIKPEMDQLVLGPMAEKPIEWHNVTVQLGGWACSGVHPERFFHPELHVRFTVLTLDAHKAARTNIQRNSSSPTLSAVSIRDSAAAAPAAGTSSSGVGAEESTTGASGSLVDPKDSKKNQTETDPSASVTATDQVDPVVFDDSVVQLEFLAMWSLCKSVEVSVVDEDGVDVTNSVCKSVEKVEKPKKKKTILRKKKKRAEEEKVTVTTPVLTGNDPAAVASAVSVEKKRPRDGEDDSAPHKEGQRAPAGQARMGGVPHPAATRVPAPSSRSMSGPWSMKAKLPPCLHFSMAPAGRSATSSTAIRPTPAPHPVPTSQPQSGAAGPATATGGSEQPPPPRSQSDRSGKRESHPTDPGSRGRGGGGCECEDGEEMEEVEVDATDSEDDMAMMSVDTGTPRPVLTYDLVLRELEAEVEGISVSFRVVATAFLGGRDRECVMTSRPVVLRCRPRPKKVPRRAEKLGMSNFKRSRDADGEEQSSVLNLGDSDAAVVDVDASLAPRMSKLPETTPSYRFWMNDVLMPGHKINAGRFIDPGRCNTLSDVDLFKTGRDLDPRTRAERNDAGVTIIEPSLGGAATQQQTAAASPVEGGPDTSVGAFARYGSGSSEADKAGRVKMPAVTGSDAFDTIPQQSSTQSRAGRGASTSKRSASGGAKPSSASSSAPPQPPLGVGSTTIGTASAAISVPPSSDDDDNEWEDLHDRCVAEAPLYHGEYDALSTLEREVIVVDMEHDTVLAARSREVKQTIAVALDQKARATCLLWYVASCYGGTSVDGDVAEDYVLHVRSKLDTRRRQVHERRRVAAGEPARPGPAASRRLSAAKTTMRSNIVALGAVHGAGLCRHRALLYKFLCDETLVPCYLVRGHYRPTATPTTTSLNPTAARATSKPTSDREDEVNASAGPAERHSWNVIFIQGQYFLADATLHHGQLLPWPDPRYQCQPLVEGNPVSYSSMEISTNVLLTLEECGRGATAVVKRCTLSGLSCAVKLPHEESDVAPLYYEFSVLKRLRGLSHIVQVIGWRRGIVMEYVPMSLLGFMNSLKLRGIALSATQCQQVVLAMTKALVEVHQRRMVHRDVKAENVLLYIQRCGECKKTNLHCNVCGVYCKLSDFADCVTIPDAMSEHPSAPSVGTRPYAAPEIEFRQPFGTAADMWSLGVLCAEMAEMQLPAQDVTAGVTESVLVPGSRTREVFVPDVKRKLNGTVAEVARRCLIPEPRKRITAQEAYDLIRRGIRAAKVPRKEPAKQQQQGSDCFAK